MTRKAVILIFMLALFVSDISLAAVEFKNINLPGKSNVSSGFDSKILFVQDYGEIFSDICVSLSGGLAGAEVLSETFKFMFFSQGQTVHFIDSDIINWYAKYGVPFLAARSDADKNSVLARMPMGFGFLIFSFMLAYLGLLRLFSGIVTIKYIIKKPGFAY
ncbi:MAG: hypothetical protein LBR69_08050 [Endomicrobium sp.]|jgi:uncharacterized membrane protein (DUF485 family)|nr:hypothetical protein [Endomicrobium sp.]